MGAAAGIGAIIGAGVGLLTGSQKQKAFREQAELEAARTRLSPFTGGPTGQIGQKPSLFSDVLKGAVSGATFGSQFGGGESGAVEDTVAATDANALDATPDTRTGEEGTVGAGLQIFEGDEGSLVGGGTTVSGPQQVPLTADQEFDQATASSFGPAISFGGGAGGTQSRIQRGGPGRSNFEQEPFIGF